MKSRSLIFLLVAILLIALILWGLGGSERGGKVMGNFTLKSVFGNNETIPKKYTCDGDDLSPPLSWEGRPEGTVSYVLIVDDPDAPAGTFTHWVLYNIPGDLNSLPEGVPQGKEVKYGYQGRNDFGAYGYGGPCPPRGKPHRYFFKLYALDTKLDLPPGAKRGDVERAMKGHVIGEAQLIGLYGRG
jgi:Raf kinase inhibitor-like YbhB/YbcL family protein